MAHLLETENHIAQINRWTVCSIADELRVAHGVTDPVMTHTNTHLGAAAKTIMAKCTKSRSCHGQH